MKNLIIFLLILCVQPLWASPNVLDKAFFGSPVDDALARDEKRVDSQFLKPEGDVDVNNVYYTNKTYQKFKPISYTFTEGSMRKNLGILAKKHGWKMNWDMDTDYDIPVGFSVKNKRLPEIFSQVVEQLPISVYFYMTNKVVLAMPMYDKRESETDKYAR